MKQWLDYIPLILFFASFKTLGIIPATGILMVSTILLYGYVYFTEGKLENNHKIVLGATVIFGGLTLLLNDEIFIKWKAPIVNWVLALIFIGSHFIGEKLAIERLMGHAMQLPRTVWAKLNVAWIAFFAFLGGINLYVALNYDFWVTFKVFGSLGITLVFIIVQMVFLSRHLPKETDTPANSDQQKD